MLNENAAVGPARALDGRMLFYKQPELLNHEAHGSLGLRRPERPFEFARCVRVLPLTLAEIPSAQKHYEEFAVVIDRAANSVTDEPEQRFFDGDKVTPETQSMLDFCARYDAEVKLTAAFGQRLRELGLLVGQQVTRTAPGSDAEPFASYFAVDRDKLNELGESDLRELFSSGCLAGAYAHLFSLENWQLIIERHVSRFGAPGSD